VTLQVAGQHPAATSLNPALSRQPATHKDVAETGCAHSTLKASARHALPLTAATTTATSQMWPAALSLQPPQFEARGGERQSAVKRRQQL